jgi:hypothetical protein
VAVDFSSSAFDGVSSVYAQFTRVLFWFRTQRAAMADRLIHRFNWDITWGGAGLGESIAFMETGPTA